MEAWKTKLVVAAFCVALVGLATGVLADEAKPARHQGEPSLSGPIINSNGGSTRPVRVGQIATALPTHSDAAMTSDKGFLYVLQGRTIYKVRESDLRTVGSRPLGTSGEVAPATTKRTTKAPIKKKLAKKKRARRVQEPEN